ncbi:MAG: hypothetical protein U0800_06005 [Isosphaeraceae bacterium]
MRVLQSACAGMSAMAIALGVSFLAAGCGGGDGNKMAEPPPPGVQEKQIETLNKEYGKFYKDQARQAKKKR